MALVILLVLGLVFVAAVIRVIWSAWRGDMQVEGSSHGRLVGRSEKKRKTD